MVNDAGLVYGLYFDCDTNSFYGCVKYVHMVRYCPNVRNQCKVNSQAQSSGLYSEAPKRNHFNALKASGENESSPDVVTDVLQFSLLIFMLCFT